jgi:iron(III) transport system ATP-binding protein
MIRIQGLTKTFGGVGGRIAAVNGIDLEVEEGEFCVLLGPSGCGKTTTLRCIAGLERPDGGLIRIGHTLVAHPETGVFVPPEKRDISMVFQSDAIWPHMTVYDNVAFPLSWGKRKVNKHEVGRKVDHALALVKLEALKNRPSTDLSGGQQQRVALARALALEAKVILMDEPLSNLDARLRDEMRIELKRLTSQLRVTTLYVTHDQIEALSLADKVCVMNEGSLLQIGKPEEVYKQPRDRFVSEFLGQMNFLTGRIAAADCVESEIGKLAVMIPRGLTIGDEITLGIRPESIALRRNSEEVSRFPQGEVTVRSFLGNSVLYEVRVGDAMLRVQTGDDSFLPQDSIELHFPADAWRLFLKS